MRKLRKYRVVSFELFCIVILEDSGFDLDIGTICWNGHSGSLFSVNMNDTGNIYDFLWIGLFQIPIIKWKARKRK